MVDDHVGRGHAKPGYFDCFVVDVGSVSCNHIGALLPGNNRLENALKSCLGIFVTLIFVLALP